MKIMQLIQISDSAFPIGGYAYSHGLEAMFRLGYVRHAGDVRDLVEVHIEETLGRCDLPLLIQAHALATMPGMNGLVELDHLAHALKTVPAYRDGSVRMGKRFLDAVNSTFPDAQCIRSFDLFAKRGTVHGHHAVAFGITTADLGFAPDIAAGAFAQSAIQGYVGAAVRLSIIGQFAAQQVSASLHSVAERAVTSAALIHLDDLGGYTPVLDFAGLVHTGLSGRQFSS
jgi:urease accessory protein